MRSRNDILANSLSLCRSVPVCSSIGRPLATSAIWENTILSVWFDYQYSNKFDWFPNQR